jgi:2-oxoglutarate dehydrogenase E2 component (dihydrolipoamide succinyltransferase)
MHRHTLRLPDLGCGDQPVSVSMWLVSRGDQVFRGDPLVEILVGSAVVDLHSGVDGVLTDIIVDVDELIHVGQTLAEISVPQKPSATSVS